MKFLNKTGAAVRLLVAISLIATAGCSSPPSRTVEAPQTCVDNYSGDTNDAGRAHGVGDRVWANCDRCSGLWSEGSMADGTCIWSGGDKYEGQWKSDGAGRFLMHGEGTYYYADDSVYSGQFENGMFRGRGTYIFPNGEKYVGDWLDDKKHGQGTYIWPNGNKYVGDWLDNKQHGKGSDTRPDGYKYVGDYRFGEQTGIATVTFPDGRKFVGSVNAGVMGEGTYTGPWPEGVSEALDAERREKQRLADEQNRIEKRLEACDSFGFERGTEAHAECAMKLYMNEQNQVMNEQNQGASKPPASTQTSSNDQQLAAIARQQAIQEATLKEQKRIQELEASLRMMQFGIDLMNGTSTPRRPSQTHSQTYSINGQIIRCTTTGSITTCL